MRHLNALNKIEGIGPKKLKMLLGFFGSGEAAWKASTTELKASGIGEKTAERINLERNSINPEKEWGELQRENVRMTTIDAPEYPSLLKEISNPPYILYLKGSFEMNSHPAIAIVGARKCTSYGTGIARAFAKDLSIAGITVVSGMALGIDTFAHRGALEGGGKTIAVLGNSLDDRSIYPRDNFNLSREIMESGVLVSEYPIETKAGTLTFPARNRIVAGLARGTLVVEAGEKSGALITAQMALEENRDVFAVPGSIFSNMSVGVHALIKSGAKLVSGVADILEEFDFFENKNIQETPKSPSSPEEEVLLKILSSEPLHIDNIARIAKLQTASVSSALSVMEIKGWVKNIGGQNYIIL